MTNEQKKFENALSSYSDLLIRTVANTIYLDPPQLSRNPKLTHQLFRRIANELPEQKEARREQRLVGRDWPSIAHSMAGYARLQNLAMCVQSVLSDNVPGDFIETGVWRGGACILMRGISKAAGHDDRKVYVADSFQGLPPPDEMNYPADKGDTHHEHSDALGISLEMVRENFRAYDLLDENVIFLEGWFKDTLPTLNAQQFAIVRLDGDMYESTIQAIEILYPKLSVGGYLIVDDFGAVKGCARAINDYRAAHGITEQIQKVDWTGVYWRKTE